MPPDAAVHARPPHALRKGHTLKNYAIPLTFLVMLGPFLLLVMVATVVSPVAATTCLAGDLAVRGVSDELTIALADGTTVMLDRAQLGHAATIIRVGARTAGVDRDAVLVALMAALTESGLRMLANTTAHPQSADYSHDGDGSDHDSLGLFQMRPSSGWGTVEQLMDPAYQARAFYGGLTGPNHSDPPGLLDTPNWRALGKGAAAQTVEVSAYPQRYDLWEPAARQILAALTAPTHDGNQSDPVLESSSVVFPLPEGSSVKTSDWGWRTHPITGQSTLHAGTDYAAPDGTPILATADGVVVFAGPLGGYGTAIDIQHTIQGVPVTSRYGHMWMGHLYVAAGDHVLAGQHIADVGSNGDSTGPHLHFEIRVDETSTDPERWLADHGASNLTGPSASAARCHLEAGS